MKLQITLEGAAAAKVAEYLESAGHVGDATNIWRGLCLVQPHARTPREKLGDLLFEQARIDHPLGTKERSRAILQVILQSLPTPRLSQAYFENLEQLLRKTRRKRSRPGRLVLGIGAGRCGSTTLSSALAAVPDVISTHEQPPFVFWEPIEDQLRFHFARFRMLADYYSIVFDAAHWWLNAASRFLAEFPQGKIVSLVRDTDDCVESFLRIKGRGPGSENPWAPPGNRLWKTNWANPTYPVYPTIVELITDPEAAKRQMIERYVQDYHDACEHLARAEPLRLLSIATEQLSAPQIAERLSSFLGTSVDIANTRLNVGSTCDSNRANGDVF